MKIRNTQTGELVTFMTEPVERSLYRLRRACVAMARLELESEKIDGGLAVYFLTLTLGNDYVHVESRALNNFFCWMRNKMAFEYIWVASVQKSRLAKTGVEVLHWHVAILCKRGALPDSEYLDKIRHRDMHLKRDGDLIKLQDLMIYWKYGLHWCERGRYLSGGLTVYLVNELKRNIEIDSSNRRRFGSSRFGPERLPEWAYEWVKGKFDESGQEIEAKDLYVKRVPGKVQLCVKDDGGEFKAVFEKRSPWKLISNR